MLCPSACRAEGREAVIVGWNRLVPDQQAGFADGSRGQCEREIRSRGVGQHVDDWLADGQVAGGRCGRDADRGEGQGRYGDQHWRGRGEFGGLAIGVGN